MRSATPVQKPGAGVPAYTRWVNRWMGRHIATAMPRWVTPNGVTAISGALSLVAIVVMLTVEPSVPVGVLVAVLLAAGYAFDSADGQLARMRSVGGPAGEWLDHVVDAVRMPAIHLAVLLALLEPSGDVADAVRIAAPLFCVVTFGQFMSQILAEQLSRQQGQNVIDETASDRRSWMLLLTDTGALLWSFVLWGWSNAFVVVYVVLLVITAGYTLVSMRRKFRRLQALRA